MSLHVLCGGKVKIAISGASGFLGRHLLPFLEGKGHQVVPIVRKRDQPGIFFDPSSGEIDLEGFAGVNAVIHLAGESVAERWNPEKKQLIYNSRVVGTQKLVENLAALPRRPRDFICASAIGYYGNRNQEVLTEDSSPGTTFLSRVCVDWEAAAQSASGIGMRVANLRFGIVLSTTGGAFPKMAAPFEIGAGGRLGNGRQFMSWIALDDTLESIAFILENETMEGPVNIVSPSPITNDDFTTALAGVLGKPAVMSVPATMAYLAYGTEMTDEVLLASDRAVPEKLSSAGFSFKYQRIEAALQHIIADNA